MKTERLKEKLRKIANRHGVCCYFWKTKKKANGWAARTKIDGETIVRHIDLEDSGHPEELIALFFHELAHCLDTEVYVWAIDAEVNPWCKGFELMEAHGFTVTSNHILICRDALLSHGTPARWLDDVVEHLTRKYVT